MQFDKSVDAAMEAGEGTVVELVYRTTIVDDREWHEEYRIVQSHSVGGATEPIKGVFWDLFNRSPNLARYAVQAIAELIEDGNERLKSYTEEFIEVKDRQKP